MKRAITLGLGLTLGGAAVVAALLARGGGDRPAADGGATHGSADARASDEPRDPRARGLVHRGPAPHRPLTPSTGGAGTGPGAGTASGASPGEVPGAPPSRAFEQEDRDATWALEQERELTLRLRRIVDDLAAHGTPVDVDAIECRRTQCRVGLHARDAAGLGRLYGRLESDQGFHGWADALLLGGVETASDGQVTTRVTALFERE
ncbi:MAG: hypothetical protein KJZ91_22575 [Myxococcales bacterium]|nr:hypothetical protein [Myxococcales bacterium]